jgi:hypothetical protein
MNQQEQSLEECGARFQHAYAEDDLTVAKRERLDAMHALWMSRALECYKHKWVDDELWEWAEQQCSAYAIVHLRSHHVRITQRQQNKFVRNKANMIVPPLSYAMLFHEMRIMLFPQFPVYVLRPAGSLMAVQDRTLQTMRRVLRDSRESTMDKGTAENVMLQLQNAVLTAKEEIRFTAMLQTTYP